MRAAVIIALGVQLMAAGAALGLDVEKCSDAEQIFAHHATEGEYEDLGNSLVMFGSSSSGEMAWSLAIDVLHCRSGEGMKVWAAGGNYEVDSPDRSDEIRSIVREMVSSDQVYKLSGVLERLEEKGIGGSLYTDIEEVCACKALYPRDRAGKVPFVYKSNVVGN